MKNGKKGKMPAIMIAIAMPKKGNGKMDKAEKAKEKMEMKKDKMEMKAYESMIKAAKGSKAKKKGK